MFTDFFKDFRIVLKKEKKNNKHFKICGYRCFCYIVGLIIFNKIQKLKIVFYMFELYVGLKVFIYLD